MGIRVAVNFGEAHVARQDLCGQFEDGCEVNARTAPGRVKIYNPRRRAFQDHVGKIVIGQNVYARRKQVDQPVLQRVGISLVALVSSGGSNEWLAIKLGTKHDLMQALSLSDNVNLVSLTKF